MTHPRLISQVLFISALVLPLAAFAAEPPELVKSDTSSAVYWIQNGLRRPFPQLAIYQSWFGSSFALVNTVPQTTLANFPLGKSVPFNKGSLVKIQTDPKVYYVADAAGSLEWIPTEEAFKARGLSFKDVRDVPDSLFGDYSIKDFATPSVPVVPTPAPTTTSTPETPPPAPAFEIQNLVIKNEKTDQGSKNTFTFSTNEAASITLTYSDSATTAAITRTADTQFTIPFYTSLGINYTYSIKATTAAGTSTEKTGTFKSYSDVVVDSVSVPSSATAFTATPPVIVAAYSIKNNSKENRFFNEIYFAIESLAKSDLYYGRTLQIVRYDNKTASDNLGEVTFASGSSGVSQYKRQKFTFNETLAPGETKTYAIVVKKVLSPDETIGYADSKFKIILQTINFFGDTSVLLPNEPLVSI